MRAAARKLGYNPVVPPKKNRIDPWEYDRILYKRRNEVERFFRRIKRLRRVFTRYDKLDIVFAGFILFAMIFDSLVRTDSGIMRRFDKAMKCYIQTRQIKRPIRLSESTKTTVLPRFSASNQ